MAEGLVSTKYQIVIPKKIRQKIGLKPGQKLNIYTLDDSIVITPTNKWPEEHLKGLRNLWRTTDIKTFLKEERSSWQ